MPRIPTTKAPTKPKPKVEPAETEWAPTTGWKDTEATTDGDPRYPPPWNRIIDVTVRWWDGYIEKFEATEVRAGCDLLWMRLDSGQDRSIPLRGVRWFSRSPESHGDTP